MLAQLREASEQTLIDGPKPDQEAMEEGEEPTFTYAEETKRAIRREDRKKRKAEEFRIAKENCTYFWLRFCLHLLTETR